MLRPDCLPDVSTDSSRELLARAELAETNGDLIAAGVLLREAVRHQLYAMAICNGVLPKRAYAHSSPRILANRLWQAGLIDADGHRRIREMIHVGNAAAHCNPIDRELLAAAIHLLRRFIESATFVEASHGTTT